MPILRLVYFWFCYAFPFLPACPGIGRREDADCIFAQSIGRRSFTESEVASVLHRIRVRVRGDDWQTFLNLAELGFKEGRINTIIGGFCKRIVVARLLHLMGQWEVMYAVWKSDPEWYRNHAHLLHVVWPPENGYLTTPEVKEECVHVMRALGLSRPLEASHPAIRARSVAILWRMNVAPIVEPVSPFLFWTDELWQWDPDSVQEWVHRFMPSSRALYARPHAVAGKQHMGWINLLNQLLPCFAKYEFAARVQHVLYGHVAIIPQPPATT